MTEGPASALIARALKRLDPEAFLILAAMIESFQDDEKTMARQIADLVVE